jgi:hypothetical protein
MQPTIHVRWTKLPVERIIQQVTMLEMETLAQLKKPIQEVLDRNVGTQYFSLADLRKLGHPYRIGGSARPGGIPTGVINRQSGEFHRSLVIRGPLILGRDRVSITVYSRGEKSLGGWLLSGTDKMRGRPWTKHLRTEIYKIVVPALLKLERRIRLRIKV